MIDTMDANVARRRTGLTRAKHIERITLWLGLPLLLALLCLTAGIVNYSPVHPADPASRPDAVPSRPIPVQEAPSANPMPMGVPETPSARPTPVDGESAVPQAAPAQVDQTIHIDPNEIQNLS